MYVKVSINKCWHEQLLLVKQARGGGNTWGKQGFQKITPVSQTRENIPHLLSGVKEGVN